jgi:chemotaxis protein histidine kinase CheA
MSVEIKCQTQGDEECAMEIPLSIIENFRAESKELLADMEGALMELEAHPDDDELVGRSFRALHTIKGNASMLGFDAMQEFAHDLEHLFDLVRKGRKRASREIVDATLSAKDRLLALLEPNGDTVEETRLREVIRGTIQGLIADDRPAERERGYDADAQRCGVQLFLDDDVDVSGCETRPSVEDASQPGAPGPEAKERESHSRTTGDGGELLRVGAAKLDLVINLVGELVTAETRLARLAAMSANSELQLVAEEVGRLSGELRDASLNIRMVPVGPTFGRFRRLVRDLTRELGREAELVTEGGETELDKTVIDRLGDPLVHLLRNCVDHGIEPPGDRERAGKPRCGTVRLEAGHAGSQVVIRVSDDGRGIDAAAVRRIAVEGGLLAAGEARAERELFALMFLPGFSTSATVTSVSGRGVGLDVVKRAVEALRGTVEVSSRRGEGTQFEIRLPLTLAIVEGLEVAVGAERYIVPLSSVHECVEVAGGGCRDRMLGLTTVRGELVQTLRLRQWFGADGEAPAQEHLIVSGVCGLRAGVVVDQVIGVCQAVIKPLDERFSKVPGFAGSTIRGDGTVALILDMAQLLRAAEQEGARSRAAA